MRWIVVACLLVDLVPAFAQAPKPAASYDALVARARTLIAENKPQQAVTVSEQAIALNEKRWEAYVIAASGYSAQRLYDDTISMLQMALGRAPEEKKPAIREAISEARRQLAAQSNPNPVASPPSSAQAAPAITTQAEAVLWKSIENSTRAEDYQGYLSKYPDGTFAPVAKARLDAITSKQAEEAAQQQRAKDSDLVGSGWQGTAGPQDLTLKFEDAQHCKGIFVGQWVSNFDCTWQKIGNALYIEFPRWCSLNNGVGRLADLVLTVDDKAAKGVLKTQEGEGCAPGGEVALKRSE
jgi:tetratricopeptide (TPR) repeat protein